MPLQVEDSLRDLLGTALVPVLGTDVAAGPAGNVHLGLVTVAALRAFPDEFAGSVFLDGDLAVEAADIAVVRLGVELCVQDAVVDVLHDRDDGGNVVLHVRDFHVGDGAAGAEFLELGFLGQLVEGVDVFGDVDVVRVGDVVLVGDTVDLTEALLQALGKLVVVDSSGVP